MMPNIDPKQLKKMMERMGIQSEEVPANRVVIEQDTVDIVIDNPQIVAIDAQGSRSFQISGEIRQVEKEVRVEVTQEDIDLVKAQTGVQEEQLIRSTLEECKGDIAQAIMKLKESGT